MGTFHVACRIENPQHRGRIATMPKVLVDTGSEFTWAPASLLEKLGIKREKKDAAFLMANGHQVTRAVGFAIIRVGDSFTIDEIVFAEPGDLSPLGTRSLEGLNMIVDPRRKKLVSAEPLPAA